jgi:hypothetical protein
MKFVLYVLAVLGSLFLQGCGLLMVPRKSSVEETAVGIRYDAAGNTVERIVAREHVREYYVPLSLEPHSWKRWGRVVEMESANQTPVRCQSLEALGRHEQFWDWMGWYFHPITGTNLWTAILWNGDRLNGGYRTNKWDRDVFIEVYLFDYRTILRTNHLTTFSPHGRHGNPELRFDPAGRHFTYKTKDGYETFEVLEGTIRECKSLPEDPVLTLKDFRVPDYGPPAGGYPDDEPPH